MTGEPPPPGWVYNENCWCEWCVAYRAARGGDPDGFVNQPAGLIGPVHKDPPPDEVDPEAADTL